VGNEEELQRVKGQRNITQSIKHTNIVQMICLCVQIMYDDVL